MTFQHLLLLLLFYLINLPNYIKFHRRNYDDFWLSYSRNYFTFEHLLFQTRTKYLQVKSSLPGADVMIL
jgi:hypothetical protein